MVNHGKLITCMAVFGISILAYFLLRESKQPVGDLVGWNRLSGDDMQQPSNADADFQAQRSFDRRELNRQQLDRAEIINRANIESIRRRQQTLNELARLRERKSVFISDVPVLEQTNSLRITNRFATNGAQVQNRQVIRNNFFSDPDFVSSGASRSSSRPLGNPRQAALNTAQTEKAAYDFVRPATQSPPEIIGSGTSTLLDEMLLGENTEYDAGQQNSAGSYSATNHPAMPQEVSVISQEILMTPPGNRVLTAPQASPGEPVLHTPRTSSPTQNDGSYDEMLLLPPANQSTLNQTKIPPTILQQVSQQVEYGKTLARRGAIYAARDEFVGAVRLISETLDQQTGGRRFSNALVEGFMALDEAEDFVSRDNQSHVILDVKRIAAYHRTDVLKRGANDLTPQQAMQQYYAHAERRLVDACGGHACASAAFHSLGKSFALRNNIDGKSNALAVPKSMVMYRIATSVDPVNSQSRNELAVLLARNGQLENAKQHLLTSLRINQTPAAWHNLAMIHNSLGEGGLAEQALDQFRLAQLEQGSSPSSSPVRWVSAEQLNALALPREQEIEAATRTAQRDQMQEGSTGKKTWLRPLKDWF